MRTPSLSDRAVKVRAYLTDETFGYTHWRAAQFSAPPTHNKPGLLLLFDTDGERDAAFWSFSQTRGEPKVATRDDVKDLYAEGVSTGMELGQKMAAPPSQLADLASAMKKVLPPELLAELLDHLDPLPRFLAALREPPKEK
jgi:hypothetical protein